MKNAIERVPQPIVEVQEPDLAEIVTAVNGLKGPTLTAKEIADAIKDVLQPVQPSSPDGETNETLKQVAEALEKLDFRLKGVGTQAYGGGAVRLEPGQFVTVEGGASESTLEAVRVLLEEIQNGIVEYAGLVDIGVTGAAVGKTIYAGKAIQGTTGAGNWHITRIWYDTNGKTRETQYLHGVWNNRAALAWKAPEDATWVSA